MSTNIALPIPQNTRIISNGCKYVELKWDRVNNNLPITYKVFAFTGKLDKDATVSLNQKASGWSYCYDCTEPKCKCTGLCSSTQYTFVVCSYYNGRLSSGYAFHTKTTDTERTFWKNAAVFAAGVGAFVGVGAITFATGGIGTAVLLGIAGVETEAGVLIGAGVAGGVGGAIAEIKTMGKVEELVNA